jgi:hypothetical protein
MAKITNVIIHCSDSEFGTAAEIRRWHMQKGWEDIGYNWVILNGLLVPETKWQKRLYMECMDGMIEVGRKVDGDNILVGKEVGAHTLGYNDKSLGLCLIGVKNFTKKQFYSLAVITLEIQAIWGVKSDMFLGHYNVAKKTCPNFNVQLFMKDREMILMKGVGSVEVDKYKLAGFEQEVNNANK